MSQGPLAASDVAGIRSALADVAESFGCDLEEVEIAKAGSRSKVTVAFDRDGGVDLDTIAELSHRVSARLDELDLIKGAYTLDVGSRGVHRPLVETRHWRRAVGRLVTVQTGDGVVKGRLVSVTDTDITVSPQVDPRLHSAKPKPPVTLARTDIKQANVDVDFRAIREEGPS